MPLDLTNIQNINDTVTLELSRLAHLHTAEVGGTTFLFTAAEFDSGISVFEVEDDGTLTNVFNLPDEGELELFGSYWNETFSIGDTTYLYTAGFFDWGVSVFEVNDDGSLVNIQNIADDDTLELQGVTAVRVGLVNGNPFLFAAGFNDFGISVFRVNNDGTLTNVDNVQDNGSLNLFGVVRVEPYIVGGQTFVVATGQDDRGLSVFSVSNSGQLTNIQDIEDSDEPEYELDGAFDVIIEEIGGTQYAIVAAVFDDGLSVWEIGDDGRLTNVFNIDDDPDLKLEGAVSLATTEVAGITYVIVASIDDDGLQIFELNADGSLTPSSMIGDDATLELNEARAVAVADNNGEPVIFAGGRVDNGISVFGAEVPVELTFSETGPFSIPEFSLAGTAVGDIDANVTGDPADDGITYEIIGGNTNADADGNAALAIDPDTGELTVNDADDIDPAATGGAIVLTIRATDTDTTDTATATVTVNIESDNDDPVLVVPEGLETDEDTGIALTGFTVTDEDSDPISVTLTDAGSTFSGTVTVPVTVNGLGSDTITVTGSPEDIDDALAEIDYTPPQDFNGISTIDVTADDGAGGMATGTVSITVNPVNDDPVVTAPNLTTAEDTPVLLSGFSVVDVDGDPVALTLINPDGIFTGASSGFVTGLGTGTITVTGDPAVVESALANISYDPPADTTGIFPVDFAATDGQGGTDTGTFTITVTDDGINEDEPIFTATGPFSVAEMSPEDTDVGDVGANINGGPEDAGITYAIINGNADVDNDTNPAFKIDVDTGEIDVNDSGDLDFDLMPVFVLTIQATNTATGDTNTATVTITLTDEPDPVLDAVDDLFRIQINEVITGDVTLDNGFGPDVVSDGATVSLVLGSGPDHGSLVLNTDGTFIYTPDTAFFCSSPAPEDSFTYQLSDGNGTTETATVSIDIGLFDPDVPLAELFPTVLEGTASRDRLKGDESSELLLGEAGRDNLKGREGDDALLGGSEKDKLNGGNGDDILFGGSARDKMRGGSGDDILQGEDGDDAVDGGEGNDLLFGGNGDDRIKAGAGNDAADGGAGDDRLFGRDGDDALLGGDGNDFLTGGKDNDRLSGGAGDDELEGGLDADTFVFHRGDDLEDILDFDIDEDQIDLSCSDFDITSFEELRAFAQQDGRNVSIRFNETDEIYLRKVDLDDLDASHFIFSEPEMMDVEMV